MMPQFRSLRPLALGLSLLIIAAMPARAVDVQRVVSPGGIEAWLVEDRSNPILSVELAFRGGAAADPAGKEGLARLASSLLDEGAGDLDSEGFQRALADNSIGLSFSVGKDNLGGSLSTLTRNRDLAFELLRLAVTAPRFDPEPVERMRSQLIVRLKRQEQDADTIAWRTLAKVMFPGHPYARPSSGTPDSVAQLNVEDLRSFAARQFTRDRLIVGVSGDIDAQTLGELLDSTFGELPQSGGAAEIPEAEASADGEVVVIERPQPQSVVAIAQPGLKRDHPDYYAANVVNHIFGGGGFTSRLYSEVREKRGLAYSVYSYLSPRDHGALVVAGVATQNARVAESLEIIRREWRRMAESGPTAEELADAKTYLTGSFPLRLSSTGKIAGMLVAMQLEDLGIDYIDRRKDYIESVTLDEARRVARALLQPEALSVVVVGQPEGIGATRPAPGSG